ncbi:MAG: hypothetical protein LBM27_03315, partial [Lactobacillaceae bacterium]|nr:hypothetical protein [Lactobacillaceae bacterium]
SIISRRSVAFKTVEDTFDDMSLNEAIQFVIGHPQVLRRPLITDWDKIQVGFHQEEIRKFLPKNYRKAEIKGYNIEDMAV